MNKFRKIFLVMALLIAPPVFSEERTEFESWIFQHIHGNFVPDQHHLERAKNYHYFFVTGFLNEALRLSFVEYYYDLIREMRHYRMAALHSPISLPSTETASVNAEKLYGIFSEEAPGDQKDLVLIGHSKGALELFLMSLKHPDFIRKRVRAVFLLQGAIGGSPIADYIAGDPEAGVPDKLQWWERGAFEFIMLKSSALRRIVEKGLHSLTRKNAKSSWENIGITEEEKTLLNEHLFYVCSKIRRDGIGLLSILGKFLYLNHGRENGGQNDGLVLLKDQYTDWFGKPLATLTADHSDLVLRTNPETRRMRKGLALAMIQWVGRPQ